MSTDGAINLVGALAYIYTETVLEIIICFKHFLHV